MPPYDDQMSEDDLKLLLEKYGIRSRVKSSFNLFKRAINVYNKSQSIDYDIALKKHRVDKIRYDKEFVEYKNAKKEHKKYIRGKNKEERTPSPIPPKELVEPVLDLISISDQSTVIDHIIHNTNITYQWSNIISFDDLQSNRKLSNSFVFLDLFLTPKSLLMEGEVSKKISFKKLTQGIKTNITLLGEPGAGKTTLMKFLCHRLLTFNGPSQDFTFPILIKFREFLSLTATSDIWTFLIKYFGFNIDIEHFGHQSTVLLKRRLVEFVDSLNALIIFEGFDELPTKVIKETIAKNLNQLSLTLTQTKFIITSRTADFDFNIENAHKYEISPLTESQIKEFVLKWIEDKADAIKFVEQLNDSPFKETAVRPLTLAHLSALYLRFGGIPEKPKEVYQKIVRLLLDEWDIQRSIHRRSKYGNFEADRKLSFLANLAYLLTVTYQSAVFSLFALHSCYQKLAKPFGLPNNEKGMFKVIEEVESHNGLIVRTGYNKYQFAHKSVQEYLTAEYIVRLPYISMDSEELKPLPDELALATALSSDATNYLAYILLIELRNSLNDLTFIKPFLSRVIIERPDFSPDPILSVVVLILIGHHSKEESTSIMPLIRQLVRNETVKESFENLYLLYFCTIRDENKFLDGSEKTRINKRENIEAFKTFRLPSTLFSPREFAELFMPNMIKIEI